MASEWPTVKLEDIAEIIDSRHKTPTYSEVGFPMVRVVDIKGGRLDLSATKRVSEAVYEDFSKGRDPKLGDLIISRVGSYGNVSYVDSIEKFCLGQNTALIAPKSDSRFLYYCLKSPQIKQQIEQMVVGAVQKTISLKSIRNLEVPQPETNIKNKVAKILGALDDKIELNKKINQTLEQMAQALFKSWFVDFDPVFDNLLDKHDNNLEKAKAYLESKRAEDLCPKLTKRFEQRQQTKDQKPLPQDIRNLFPSDFEESEVGWIPKRWGSKTLYELAEFINGAAYKKFEPNTKGIGWPIIKIAELKGGITAKTGFSTVDMPEKYHLVDKDILFSWSGNPETSIDTFVWASGDAWLNQHIFKVVPNSLCSYSFILALLKHLKPAFTAIARDKQTTGLGHVTVKDLKNLQIVMPPKELISKLDEQLSSIYDHMFLNLKVNQALDQTKKTLLPKLINGTIKVGS